jgi:hypothetical protein
VGVFLAAGIYFLFASVAHLQPGQIFLAGAIMTVAATLYPAVALQQDWRRENAAQRFQEKEDRISPQRAQRTQRKK